MPLNVKTAYTVTNRPPLSTIKQLGIIAGHGDLPRAIASEAKKMGYRVTAIALHPFGDESLKTFVDIFHKIRIGNFGKIINVLKKECITETVLAGKVHKSILYKDKKSLVPDLRAVKFLLSLKDYSDMTLLQAISKELKKDGITVLNTTSFTKNLLTPEGVLTKIHPNQRQYEDIEFGWVIAKEIGRLDIGQTVVVKDKAVMAVEALEGTDEAIVRGGTLAKKDAVVIKVSRPQQDMRFDVPVVGLNTLSAIRQVKAKVLALEAGKSIIVDKEKFVKQADRVGIIIVGINNIKNK
ncbi:MAG: UDP-2,3-diacylglucosamine diphosphatase LpxI [Thermodesulfovibrionia bacterium]|nr:UDP-2,3-diacylglucosamine diphosphatase LpxI [Thermodesulfovibrionia bacterium]